MQHHWTSDFTMGDMDESAKELRFVDLAVDWLKKCNYKPLVLVDSKFFSLPEQTSIQDYSYKKKKKFSSLIDSHFEKSILICCNK